MEIPDVKEKWTNRINSVTIGMTFTGTGLAPAGTLRLITAHLRRYIIFNLPLAQLCTHF